MTARKSSVEENLQLIADLDRNIHAPARLMLLALLAVVHTADFTFLMTQTGLTRGNLATQLGKLEEAGYLSVEKTFVDRVPRTIYHLTDAGRQAIQDYRQQMRKVVDDILGG